ncbi:MAG TPA: hypothetical protein VHX44_08720 [Planctomycetota bacterium]|jgi:hypothetical protein|nr:hypothetical protein [Planctomycetota bacterium]
MRSLRHPIIIGVGIVGVLASLAYVLYLFCTWTHVVLMHTGSLSERRYLDRLAKERITDLGMADLMITEVTVRRVWASQAVRIAREIDPTGDKIVITYPDYTRTTTGEMKLPRDAEKP